jgi:diguanylate cyclase (GGDEF)-like protein
MKDLNDLLEGEITLPSPPSVAIKLLSIIKKEKLTLQELTEVISYEPAMAAKILSISNSAFYALPYKVDTIDDAISVLGMNVLKNMTLSLALIKDMKKDKTEGFDHEFFWRRSVTTAVAAELLSFNLGEAYKESFVAALLMDIGVLAMYLSSPEDYLRVLDVKRLSGLSVIDAEKSVFNCDHQEVGSRILKRWNIPENICSLISSHHADRDVNAQMPVPVNILQIADLTSSVYHGNRSIEKFNDLRDLYQREVNDDEYDFHRYLDSVANKTIELLSFFEIGKGDMKPYSEVLQEANEELRKLNLSYAHVVIELKQAKERSESFAMELKAVNEQLRERAYRDELTGLYNHRYFHEMMEAEMNRASRYQHAMSLIMLDIDNFKHINDTYGHPQGDEVLRSVSFVLQQSIRACDIVSRYGGEEFTIVLPETDMQGVVTIAERVRRGVESQPINFNGNSIKVTVSLGATTFEPVRTPEDKSIVITAADNALYNAKTNGKNRLSVAAI